MKTLVITLILALGAIGSANEPGWTSAQRTEQRQAVVDATVTKVEKVRDQSSAKVELMRAVLQITNVRKGKELLGDTNTIEVLYETSPLGAGYRCPTFPVLIPKQQSRFYLRFDASLSEEKKFVVGMGSDVEPIPLDSATVMPILTEALSKNPTFDDLVPILGAPHLDIGSGIHVFVYIVDKGASIIVGTPDKKKVLYVKRGAHRLYPTKPEQVGADRPAPESKPEGKDKPKPESEGRAQ